MVQLTIDQAMQIAVQHHLAGRLQQAEQLYRQILAQTPEHVLAVHNLGLIAQQTGRIDLAVDLIGRELVLRPNDAEARVTLGNVLKASGRIDEAIAAYRHAIALRPDFPEAHYNLGFALGAKGQLDEAIAAYRRAIKFDPKLPEAYNNLGNALKEKGQLDEAIFALRQAIALRPTYAEAHSNLGNLLGDKGQLDEAIAACRQAIALNPNLADAQYNLGFALGAQGQLDEAITAYQRTIAARPTYAEAHSNLGNALKEKGQLDEAITAYQRAIAVRPTYAEAHYNLGNALNEKGQLDEAILALRQAIALRPAYAEAHSNLGNLLGSNGQLHEAIAACRQAIALNPNLADAQYNLGFALGAKGQLDEAIVAYRQAIALKPDMIEAHNNLGVALKQQGRANDARIQHEIAVELAPENPGLISNLLLALQYNPDCSVEMSVLQHRRFEELHGKPLAKQIRPHTNAPDPDRRLKIGYVSPDFRDHIVGRNILPLLGGHDHERFEVFCYANHAGRSEDPLTAHFRTCADEWRNIARFSDEQVAELVRADGIDILVDLALHTANNRLLVFARKPAPVQVTWAGYPGTTGLSAIDYRLTDPYLDPPGQDDEFYSERSIQLPDSFWCYDPAAMMLGLDREPQVSPLPALNNGYLTVGCLNNFAKVNARVLDLWAQVLKALAKSRLLVGAYDGTHRQLALDRLRQNGIDPNRIEFVAPCPRREYLERYHRIDVGLDTVPYNGHTTSLDAFWMGVPVVTLVGETVVGRAGVSQLSNLGLSELIAHSLQQYVEIVAKLGEDLPRLTELRSTLRERMLRSPLTDANKFARNIEVAYREVWRRWCSVAGVIDR